MLSYDGRSRYNDVSVLLQGAPDLLDQFSMFLPEVIRCSIQSTHGAIHGENMDAWWVLEAVVVLVPVSLARSASRPWEQEYPAGPSGRFRRDAFRAVAASSDRAGHC